MPPGTRPSNETHTVRSALRPLNLFRAPCSPTTVIAATATIRNYRKNVL